MTLVGQALVAVNCKPGRDGQRILAGLLFIRGTTDEVHTLQDVDTGQKVTVKIDKALTDGRRSWSLVSELEIIR